MNGFIEALGRQMTHAKERKAVDLDGAPACSWWTDYVNFYALAKSELHRMRGSRYGRMEALAIGHKATATRRREPSLLAEED